MSTPTVVRPEAPTPARRPQRGVQQGAQGRIPPPAHLHHPHRDAAEERHLGHRLLQHPSTTQHVRIPEPDRLRTRPSGRPHRGVGRLKDLHGARRLTPEAVPDLGPGQRDGPPPRVHPGHGHPGVYFCDPASPGSAARTRTRKACHASTFPRAPTCPFTTVTTWRPWLRSPTDDQAKRSAGNPRPSACINCSPHDQHNTCCNDPWNPPPHPARTGQ